MSDYLGNLAAKALNRTQGVEPRLASHFEPLPGTSGAMPSEVFSFETASDDSFTEASTAASSGRLRRSSHRAHAPQPPASHAAFSPDRGQLQLEGDIGAAVTHQTRQAVEQSGPPAVTAQVSEPGTEPVRHAPSLVLEPAQALPAAMTDAPPEAAPYVARGALHPSRMEPLEVSLIDDGTSVTRPRGDREPSDPSTSDHERQAHVAEPVVTRQDAPSSPLTTSSPIRSRPPLTPVPVVAQPQITTASEPPAPVSVEQVAAPDASPTIRVHIGRVEVRAIMPPAPPDPRTKPERRGPALSLDAYLKRRNGGQR